MLPPAHPRTRPERSSRRPVSISNVVKVSLKPSASFASQVARTQPRSATARDVCSGSATAGDPPGAGSGGGFLPYPFLLRPQPDLQGEQQPELDALAGPEAAAVVQPLPHDGGVQVGAGPGGAAQEHGARVPPE